MKKHIKLFEEFTNPQSLIGWLIQQATKYAETFIDIPDDAEEGEDDNEGQNYDVIMSVVGRFESNPQSLTDQQYSDMLFWIANANYYELGEAEYSWEPMNYDDFMREVASLKDDVDNSEE